MVISVLVAYYTSGAVHSPLDWPEDEWDRVIKTNLTGSWLVAKHICRRMRDAKLNGSVVNITSIAGLNRGHLPGSTGYASSKAAVHYATKVALLILIKRLFCTCVRDKQI
jgi:NAD(P)-dependent dehydrogenase (short-subunit alcohol dehydrogenase family)